MTKVLEASIVLPVKIETYIAIFSMIAYYLVIWLLLNIRITHRFRSSTQRLQTIVSKINDVVQNKIENEIAAIQKVVLFDEDQVLGKTWNIKQLLGVIIIYYSYQGEINSFNFTCQIPEANWPFHDSVVEHKHQNLN